MKSSSFQALPRPIVTCILKEKTVDDAIATIRNGEFDGAPAFAIHLELWAEKDLTDENFKKIVHSTKKPIMFLRYRDSLKQSPCSFSDEERAELLIRAVSCGAAAIDFTADMFDPSPMEFSRNEKAIDKQRKYIDRAHSLGAEVVMSSHIQEARSCEQVVEHLKAVERRGVDFAKIVTIADTDEEFIEAVRTTLVLHKEMKIPFIHLCGGKFALPHRYLSPMLGNALTFCVQRYSDIFVTPQPPVTNMLNVLRNVAWHID